MSVVPWKHLLAVPVLFILYFYGLNQVGLLGPDEPRYASIGREMAVSGDWITPRLWGQPWFEKPALLYWLVGSGYKAGWGDDAAPRLPVAFVCAAFLVFYFHMLRREFGERSALYSAIILSTTAGWLAYGQIAVTDMPLAVTFSASMLCCFAWVRSGGRRGLTIGGILLGLAVLSKGLVPLVLALPLAWVGRKRWRDLLLFAATAAAVALPWYVLCWHRNGAAFVNDLIWKQHFARFFEGSLQHVQPFWFYLPVLAGLLMPWTPAIVLLLRRRNLDLRHNLLLGWFCFGLLFFSLSQNKLPGYVLPLLPAACALAGRELAELRRNLWILPSCALLVGLLPFAAQLLPSAIIAGMGDVDWRRLPLWPLAAGIVLAAACAFSEVTHRRTLAVSLILAGVCAGILYIKLTTYPMLDAQATARPLWQTTLLPIKDKVCLDNVHRIWVYGLNFYANEALSPCDSSDRKIRVVSSPSGPPHIAK